jgi:predicted dehydrogenase
MLKAAVIGCGRMGAFTHQDLEYSMPKGWSPHNHAAALKAVTDIDLVALCDISDEMLQKAAMQFDVKDVYSDYNNLFDSCDLDIITVATRTDIRPDIIKSAVAPGVKGLHPEKPLSQSIKQGKEVIDILKAKDVGFTYGVYRRYIEVYQKAKEICDSGDLGELLQVSVSFGKTHLLWNLPHVADLLLFFSSANKAEWTSGVVRFSSDADITLDQVDDDPVVETATVMFENGVIGVINAAGGLSVSLSLTGGEITVGGDGTWLEVKRPNGHIRTPYYYDRQTIISQPLKSGMQIAIEELRDQLTVNKTPTVSYEEVIEAQRLLYSIVLSELNGGIRFLTADVMDDFVITGRIGSLIA